MNKICAALFSLLFFPAFLFGATGPSVLNIYNPLVLSGSRCTGMAGAVVSLGDASEDIFYNPASAALRNKFQTDYFEWDYALSFANVFTQEDIDYRNAREVAPDYEAKKFQYSSLGLSFLFGSWAYSLTVSSSSTWINNDASGYKLEETLFNLGVAHAWLKNRLYVAFSFSFPKLTLKDENDDPLLEYNFKKDIWPNPQLGMIYQFPALPLKLGMTLLLNINGTVQDEGNSAPIPLPKETRHPTRFVTGASWKFPLKTYQTHPLFSQNRFTWEPEYLIIAADLEIIGKVSDGVDILTYTDGGDLIASGRKILYQPRLGLELSFPEWLKIRAGYYLEGARISDSTYRSHLTFNLEMSLLRFWGLDLAIGSTLDYARDFWSLGFSAKIWKY